MTRISKRLTTLVLILLALPVLILAQENLVAYVEGAVEYSSGNGWSSVDIGQTLPAGATVKLTEGDYIEIVQGRTTFRYSQAGEYRLSSAASEAAEDNDTDLRGLLRNKVGRLSGRITRVSAAATTGGVRASEAASEPQIDWAGDEAPEELIKEGLSLLEEGELEEASYLFEEAYDFATGPTVDEAGFFFGYSLYLLDESDFALDILADLSPEPEAAYYTDYVLLSSELLLIDGDTAEAQGLLRDFLSTSSNLAENDPISAQAARFLYGRALEERGDSGAAEQYRLAAEILPGTALAEEARRRAR